MQTAKFKKDASLNQQKNGQYFSKRIFCVGESYPCSVDVLGSVTLDLGNGFSAWLDRHEARKMLRVK